MTVRRKPRKGLSKEVIPRSRGWKIFDWVVVIIFVLLVMIGGISALTQPPETKMAKRRITVPKGDIIVQVINGSGNSRASSILTQYLCSNGVDVRDVKEYKGKYPYSLLLNRKESSYMIDSLRQMLGIEKGKVILQRSNVPYDATIIIGKDYMVAFSKLMSQ